VSGSLRVRASEAKTRVSYDWQYSLDGVTWTEFQRTVVARAELAGLVPGTRVFVRSGYDPQGQQPETPPPGPAGRLRHPAGSTGDGAGPTAPHPTAYSSALQLSVHDASEAPGHVVGSSLMHDSPPPLEYSQATYARAALH